MAHRTVGWCSLLRCGSVAQILDPPRTSKGSRTSGGARQRGNKLPAIEFPCCRLGPFALIVLVVVLRHETWCSIVEILELGGVRAVERRVARERHQELLARRGSNVSVSV